jgi:AraC family transcriptional regulator, exoenzyme S synthesis regulatory protein ExsA
MIVRSEKIMKVPQGLTNDVHQIALKLNGLTVFESCVYMESKAGTLFLEDHLLLFVLNGTYTVRFGNQVHTVRKDEMVLLQKSIVIEYEKSGEDDSENRLNYMMFFLKDEILNDFIKMANVMPAYPSVMVPISVLSVNERLIHFIESLKLMIKEPDRINPGLIKIKLLELLFDLADADDKLLFQFLQIKRKEKRHITEIIEENLFNPVSLNDLAYLSGRSLSSFKRDFQSIYNTSPLQWIRNRRLDRAKELLANSALSVTDVCYSTGFENVAHFSKVFKKRFGMSPSMVRGRH